MLAAIVAVLMTGSLVALISRRLAGGTAFLASLVVLVLSVILFLVGHGSLPLFSFHVYPLNAGIFMAAAFFTLLISLYSLVQLAEHPRKNEYFAYLLLTLLGAAGSLFAEEFTLLFLFWGLMGISLYLLVGINGEEASGAAKKTLLIVGGADFLMVAGATLVWLMTGSMELGSSRLALNGIFPVAAFILMLAGAFAKAGVMPFHSWIPAAASKAPLPVMAFLPASLDKLVGVYMIARISFDIFLVEPGTAPSFALLLIGAITVVAAVIAALFQHNFRQLLSFHAISQVGYMAMGIGTGLPVGVAGALFHMFNHAVYKSCLFLCGGAVEQQTGTAELKKLGGLAGKMPLTFLAALIAALSISGVPPFSGFASKWLIYQGLIELQRWNAWWIVWLTAAMFGSAFTLASFVKFLHAIFLGQWSENTAQAKEVEWPMWLPMLVLALICVIFGVFAFQLPLPYLVLPAFAGFEIPGSWDPGLGTVLLLASLLIGGFGYLLGRGAGTTVKPVFIGGEPLSEEEVKVTGEDFYDTVKRLAPLAFIYQLAQKGLFDVYVVLATGARWAARLADRLNGAAFNSFWWWPLLGGAILLLIVR